MRRSIVAALAVTVFTFVALVRADAQTPIRVGFMTTKTGPLAAIGLQMETGLLQFLKERNYLLAGRKVELYTVDTAATPAVAKSKLQELIQRDKVHVVLGPLAAFEALAIDDQIREAKLPIISTSAAAEDLTQRNINPWFVRATSSSAQPSHPLGEYAAKVLGYKRMAIFADDFAYSQEVSSGFQRVFEDNGGRIVQKIWTPINATDYAPYLSQINPKIDAIFLGSAGSNSLRFLRQRAEYGLKVPIVGAQTVSDEAILRNMGDEALERHHHPLVLRDDRHARQQEVRRRLRQGERLRAGHVRRRRLQRRGLPRAGTDRRQGRHREQRTIHAPPQNHENYRRPARPAAVR